jgi:amidase
MSSYTDDLVGLDATAQAGLVRSGELTARDLVQAVIERIDRFDGAMNSVINRRFEAALHEADRVPAEGPFGGVPFLLKDLVADCAGLPMSSGSALLEGYVSDHDSELVRRLKQAGLIIVGKTNVPEFGILGTTESTLLGPCRNPWKLDRSVGGSSGGAAAAVAARIVPMAHASDGGGSIRIPASCCGVFGLKPTRARNPLGPDYGDLYAGLACEHAVTLSVRDSATLLDATAGPSPGDPYPAPPVRRPYCQEVGAAQKPLNIAFVEDAPTVSPIDPECVRAVQDAAHLCEALGHRVEAGGPSFDVELMSESFDIVWTSCIAATIDEWSARMGRTPSDKFLEPLTVQLYERGKVVKASRYVWAVERLQLIARAVARFFETHDVWLGSTLTAPPPPLGWFESPLGDPLLGYRRDADLCSLLPIANLTGQPAMTVPTHWTSDGLPVGTHYMSGFGDEATLFGLAAQIESERPWIDKLPPLVETS